MNARLLLQTWRWQFVKVVLVSVALLGWGILIPVIYVAFVEPLRDALDRGLIPEQFVNFGSGDLFSLTGSITLGLQHPLFLAMLGIFAVGVASTAIAGERQRGTLEVLLARPISRRAVYLTLGLATLGILALLVAVALIGMFIGASIQGVQEELEPARLPLVWINGLLLWTSFASFGLAASVTFNRSGPAVGLTLAYLVAMYFLEVLGSLWAEAEPLQAYSLFHHFLPKEILAGDANPFDFALLAALTLMPVIYALVLFPRRDLPAPS